VLFYGFIYADASLMEDPGLLDIQQVMPASYYQKIIIKSSKKKRNKGE
jgi:hypothetical protein